MKKLIRFMVGVYAAAMIAYGGWKIVLSEPFAGRNKKQLRDIVRRLPEQRWLF